MKVIVVRKVVKSEKSEDKVFYNYYLKLDNGRKIRINGVFEDDRNALRVIAERE